MESCDVFVANSRQDGMNVSVKEWAMLSQKPGVLLLSEMAGASREMIQNALAVCPLDIEGTATAYGEALAMPEAERRERLETLRSAVRKWTARDWLAGQLDELNLPLPAPAQRVATTAPAPADDVIECELVVLNREGIHARPAAQFVRCAREFSCDIEIWKDGESFSARSIMAVLTANLNCGAHFTLRATGPDAAGAVERFRALLAEFQHEG
jgi:phosphotransferase system HPr (HPr) family protein